MCVCVRRGVGDRSNATESVKEKLVFLPIVSMQHESWTLNLYIYLCLL